jgi:hypothetical protein
VPLVGTFFIDILNALVINFFVGTRETPEMRSGVIGLL